MKLRYFLMRAYLFEVLTIFMKNVNLHVTGYLALRKKCPFRSHSGPHSSRIFPYSDRIWRDIQPEYGKMREKCGPE